MVKAALPRSLSGTRWVVWGTIHLIMDTLFSFTTHADLWILQGPGFLPWIFISWHCLKPLVLEVAMVKTAPHPRGNRLGSANYPLGLLLSPIRRHHGAFALALAPWLICRSLVCGSTWWPCTPPSRSSGLFWERPCVCLIALSVTSVGVNAWVHKQVRSSSQWACVRAPKTKHIIASSSSLVSFRNKCIQIELNTLP